MDPEPRILAQISPQNTSPSQRCPSPGEIQVVPHSMESFNSLNQDFWDVSENVVSWVQANTIWNAFN